MVEVERFRDAAALDLPGVVVRAEFAVLVGPARRPVGYPGKVVGPYGARGSRRGAGPGRERDQAWRLGVVLPLLLGQLLALMSGGSAFYLEVRELEKCFIQEMPDGTMVIGADTASLGLARPTLGVLRRVGARCISSNLFPSAEGGRRWEMGGQPSDQSILPLPMLDLWSGPELRRRDLPEPPPIPTASGGPEWAFGGGCEWDASRLPLH